jgi:hypothetical protein
MHESVHVHRKVSGLKKNIGDKTRKYLGPSFFQQVMVILDAMVPMGILIQVPGLRSNYQLRV